MKKVFTAVLSCALLMAFCTFSYAGTSVTGTATVNYKKSLFSSDVSPEIRDEATKNAILNAWMKYTSSFSPAKYKEYKTIEKDFTSNIKSYVASYSIIDEKNNEDANTFTIAVKALINVVAVDNKLSSVSAAGNTASGDGNMFTFIFVARDVATVKSYDAKVTKINKSQSMSVSKEQSSMSGGTMVAGNSQKQLSKNTSGGSTVKKANKVKYKVSSAADVDAAMNEILSPAGFEVIDYADIVCECGGAEPSVIKMEFTTQAELSRGVRKEAFTAARNCEVPLFALGTLDAGLAETDPTSGLQRVFVSVNAKVYNIAKRLPRKVASVGPVQYAGLGPSAIVAKRNALSKAAKEAAKAIVDQLNAKGVN